MLIPAMVHESNILHNFVGVGICNHVYDEVKISFNYSFYCSLLSFVLEHNNKILLVDTVVYNGVYSYSPQDMYIGKSKKLLPKNDATITVNTFEELVSAFINKKVRGD